MNMELSIPDLAVLVCLSLVSVMIAFNAKGPIRATLSYGLTIVILIITTAVGVLGFNSIEGPLQILKNERALDNIPPVPDQITQTGDVIEIPQAPKVLEKVSKIDPQIAVYSASALKVLRQAESLGQSINRFDFGDPASMNDEQYETARQKANSLRSRASQIQRSAQKLSPGTGQERIHDTFVASTKILASAASYTSKFYNAENGEEENESKNQSKSLSKSALNSLNALKAKLN